jgi:hypothetical protein
MFFFEKKNQKTFTLRRSFTFGRQQQNAQLQDIKVFCFFSSEKKTFLLYPANNIPASASQLTKTSSLQSIPHSAVRRLFCPLTTSIAPVPVLIL